MTEPSAGTQAQIAGEDPGPAPSLDAVADTAATSGPGGAAGAITLPAPFPPFAMPSRPALVAIGAGVIVLVLAAMAAGILTLFFIGIVIVYLIDPPISWMARRHIPRWAGTLIMLAILVGAGLLVLDLIFTVVTTEGEQFARKLPSMLESIQAQVAASDLPASVKDTVANLGPALRDWIAHLNWGQIVATGLSGVFGLAGTLLELTVIPFFVFFVAKDLHKLTRAAGRAFPDQWRGDAARITAISVSDIGLYIRALAIIIVAVSVMIFLGLTGLGFAVDPRIGQYALFLAIFAGFTELIPNFGPYIGMVPAVIVGATISPAMLVGVLIVYLVVAFIEGQVLVPVIQGHEVSLHPGWIMLVILSGVAIAGVLGAVIAVPLVVAARDVYRYIFRRAAGQEIAPIVDEDGRVLAPGGPFEPGESTIESTVDPLPG
ncbi:MAG: AI-2E family transporter [Chloroflexota bacterium]